MRFVALLLLLATQAFAQTYPSKPVRLVVGFTPGAAAEFLAQDGQLWSRLVKDSGAKAD